MIENLCKRQKWVGVHVRGEEPLQWDRALGKTRRKDGIRAANPESSARIHSQAMEGFPPPTESPPRRSTTRSIWRDTTSAFVRRAPKRQECFLTAIRNPAASSPELRRSLPRREMNSITSTHSAQNDESSQQGSTRKDNVAVVASTDWIDNRIANTGSPAR